MPDLRHLGPTQQALLRHLLQQPEGAGVEALCARLRITHHAVRQHLTALARQGWVERGPARASGGRPQAVFRLTPAGQDLFPRNYAQISTALVEGAIAKLGADGARALLGELGARLGADEPVPADAEPGEVAQALATRLDRLGYEAIATGRGGAAQVEAYNCVFHALARAHPDVCRFDLAFLEAASGRTIEHQECLVRGGKVCRFAVGPKKPLL
jgi:predicted ArsR family transcriptional regulator